MGKEKEEQFIFIDSDCIMCNTFMQVITRADKKEQFIFIPLQSPRAKKILRPYENEDLDETVVFLKGERVYTKSEAVLRISRQLPFPWRMIHAVRVLPSKWLDRLYDWVAQNRYRWFGKTNYCTLPPPDKT